MKKSTITVVLTCIVITTGLYAQSSSDRSTVIATAGDQFVAGDHQLSWTIGEVAIEAIKNHEHMITQGFHQGEFAMKNIAANPLDLDVTLFPNPSFDWMTINIPNNHPELLVQLFDVSGQLVVSASISDTRNTHQIDLQSLKANTYILQISSADAKYQSSYKIIKSN